MTQMHSVEIKDTSKRGKPIGSPAWNKGLSKETDDRVRKNGESISKTVQTNVANGTYNPIIMGEDARQRLSERQSLRNSGGKSKWYDVNGKKVQGTYERDFALALEDQGILWDKIATNNHIFKYFQNGKIRSYAPDFYLPEFNIYVEIKGFWWGDDEEKMKCIKEQHHDKKIIVLFGKEKLDSICKNIRNFLPLEPVWSW